MSGVVGALLLLAPLAALSAKKPEQSKFVGAYHSVGSKNAPYMNVSFGADGTATIEQADGKGAQTFFGHWVDTGGQVKVTFDPTGDEPAEPPMIFEPHSGGLQAVTWDHAIWGKITPPPMKKAKGPKEMYWTTTVP
jgi:hypothetical protein